MAEHVIALVHNEDGSYGISFPDFPGSASGGASLDEAVRRGAATLDFHVAGMVEDGESTPRFAVYRRIAPGSRFSEGRERCRYRGDPGRASRQGHAHQHFDGRTAVARD